MGGAPAQDAAADPAADPVADPAATARVRALLSGMPFCAAWGVAVIAAADGTAVVEAPLVPAHEAFAGRFPAASVGALGDIAAICAVATRLGEGRALATHDMTVKLLGVPRGPRLRAVGHALSLGGVIGVGRAEVLSLGPDGPVPVGAVLATARVTEAAA